MENTKPDVCTCGAKISWFTVFRSGDFKRQFKCGRFIDTMRLLDTGCGKKVSTPSVSG